MKPTTQQQPFGAPDVARALCEFVHDASSEELRDALRSAGQDMDTIAAHARAVVSRALETSCGRSATEESNAATLDLRRSLGALVQLLRRRERLTPEELAARARIDLQEVQKVEGDPTFAPSPRTVYQLEQFFRLPSRTLVVLSGQVRSVGPSLHDEAVRFAARATSLGHLTRDERRLLTAFVAFLQDQAKRE